MRLYIILDFVYKYIMIWHKCGLFYFVLKATLQKGDVFT